MKLIMFLLFFITLSVGAEVAKKAPQSTPINVQEEVLQKEIVILKQERSDLIDFFKFSMGSIITILVIFLGGTIFSNYRLSTKESENIKNTIALGLKENKLEFESITHSKFEGIQSKNQEEINLINEKFNTLASTQSTEIKTDNARLVNNFQKQLEEFNINYRQQISTLESNFSTQITQFEKSIEKSELSFKEAITTSNNDTTAKIDKSVDSIDKKITSIKLDHKRTEGYMWEHRGVYVNSLNCFIDECVGFAEKDSEGMVKLSIGNVDKILDKTSELLKTQKDSFIAKLNTIPKKYDKYIDPIITKINNIEVM
ncbi:MAG: hypothetical protein ACJAXS_002565 [Colwellia sp.]|jgi:hypothetical protein